jgi:hypothetical protein
VVSGENAPALRCRGGRWKADSQKPTCGYGRLNQRLLTNNSSVIMTDSAWNDLLRIIGGELLDPLPVGFIIDSPWLDC